MIWIKSIYRTNRIWIHQNYVTFLFWMLPFIPRKLSFLDREILSVYYKDSNNKFISNNEREYFSAVSWIKRKISWICFCSGNVDVIVRGKDKHFSKLHTAWYSRSMNTIVYVGRGKGHTLPHQE